MFHGISVYSNVCVSASICALVVFIWLFFCCLFWFVWHPWYWTPVCLSSHFYTCFNYLSLLGYLVSLLGLPALSWLLEPTIKSPWCVRQSPYASLGVPSCGGEMLLHWSWASPTSLLVHLGTLWIEIIVTKFFSYPFWSVHSPPVSQLPPGTCSVCIHG